MGPIGRSFPRLETSGRVDRRRFLRRLGATSALGGAALLGGHEALNGSGMLAHARAQESGGEQGGHGNGHLGGTVGEVDNERNGFDPHEILTDFDPGVVSRDASGRTVREYEFVTTDKEIEVAPGVFFPAWTYNGRVPGPTIRATEGDRIRVKLVNASAHPHTIHFHGFHSGAMDGVPGAGEAMPGESFTYDFIAQPFGTHLYHCHSLPLVQHIHRGLYGAFIVDPKQGRPDAHEMVMVMNGFDTNFDADNEVYAVNTIAHHFMHEPIRVEIGRLTRMYVVNLTEFDLINSLHLHGMFFDV
ncbi:MAG: multicopper oxidase domain-containing protein, partial [Actinomycetota bacterium]